MKSILLMTSCLGLLTSQLFADEAAKKSAQEALSKLSADSYSWTTTTKLPEGAGGRWSPGPQEGKISKDGVAYSSLTFGENKMEFVKKGEKSVSTNREGEWQTAEEREAARAARGNGTGSENSGGGGRRRGGFGTVQVPAERAKEMLEKASEVKKEGETVVATLTEEAAKTALMFPNINGAKGTLKLTLAEGNVSKMELTLEGKAEFNGEERDLARTSTTEIKDYGKTSVELPEAAKAKLEAATEKKEAKTVLPK
jgi:hypothetical protein